MLLRSISVSLGFAPHVVNGRVLDGKAARLSLAGSRRHTTRGPNAIDLTDTAARGGSGLELQPSHVLLWVGSGLGLQFLQCYLAPLVLGGVEVEVRSGLVGKIVMAAEEQVRLGRIHGRNREARGDVRHGRQQIGVQACHAGRVEERGDGTEGSGLAVLRAIGACVVLRSPS